MSPDDFPPEKHTHLTARLSDSKEMRYIDVRRFGRFWLLKKDEKDDFTGRHKLGLEPFDERLTSTFLKSKSQSRKLTVKEMLLDQSIVAGIGNIYADEILYAAKIHPAAKCCDLKNAEWKRLAEKIKTVMEWGINTNKISPEEYLAGGGKEYRNTPLLKIYDREGQACALCGTAVERIVIGGRSSCYCQHCQKVKA